MTSDSTPTPKTISNSGTSFTQQVINDFFTNHPHVLDWGACIVDSSPGYANHIQKVTSGLYGKLEYMQKHAPLRQHPQSVMPSAQSIVLFLMPYPQALTPFATSASPAPQIAAYAQGTDYHITAKQITSQLEQHLQNNNCSIHMRAFCDSAPILEKEWAQHIGLGWIGKNTCLLRKDFGSAFLLAGFLCDVPIQQYRLHNQNFCGNCTRCLQACPVQAIQPFHNTHAVNASLCLSAWTIEYKASLPPHIATKRQNWLFGCDICQQVCPWNHKHLQTHSQKKNANNLEKPATEPSFEHWHTLLQVGGGFKSRYKNTPLQRAGRKKLLQTLTDNLSHPHNCSNPNSSQN
jgi:epoxyqueuosine reductase